MINFREGPELLCDHRYSGKLIMIATGASAGISRLIGPVRAVPVNRVRPASLH